MKSPFSKKSFGRMMLRILEEQLHLRITFPLKCLCPSLGSSFFSLARATTNIICTTLYKYYEMNVRTDLVFDDFTIRSGVHFLSKVGGARDVNNSEI